MVQHRLRHHNTGTLPAMFMPVLILQGNPEGMIVFIMIKYRWTLPWPMLTDPKAS